MKQGFSGYTVEHYREVDSTNTLLYRRAQAGERGKVCVIADMQTGGRGRQGRSFSSPDGSGLYMSVLVCNSLPIERAMLLTPTVACCVQTAIKRVTGVETAIKWVNDLFSGDKKVAGILTETKFDFQSAILEYSVIGIGINISRPQEGFDMSISDIATGLLPEYSDSLRDKLACEILAQLDIYIEKAGSDEVVKEYRDKSMLIGRTVTLTTPEGELTAEVVDIDSECRLVVRIGDEIKALSSGEVRAKLTM